MPNKTYDFQGQGGGLVSDSNPFTLADNEWSDMNNVRIHNRAVSKIAGEAQLLTTDNEPRHSQFVNGYDTGKYYYYIDTDGLTHRINASGSEAEVTKGVGGTKTPLTTGVQYQMNPLNGGYVLQVNDGNRTPQYITSVGSGTDTTELTDIPGWSYNTAYTNVMAAVIRPFKYVQVAGNITQTVTADNSVERNAGTIRISNLAAPGNLPTWDPTLSNATSADELELTENGEVIDMVSLGDNLMIFTDDSIFSLRIASDNTPIVEKQLVGRGMLAQGCGLEFFGRLFVVGNEDIYVFQGGAGTRSVADAKTRDYFFDNVDATNYKNTFVIHNERHDEIWVCFPETGNVACNKALIYNYVDNTWTKRDLNDVWPGSNGPTITSNAFVLVDQAPQLPTTAKILTMDRGTTFDGTAFTAYVERKGLDVSPGEPNISKWTNEIYFFITGSGNATVKTRTTDTPGRPVDFSSTTDRYLSTRVFNIDGDMSDLKVSSVLNGKFLNIRIEGEDEWSLHRYTIEFKASDKRVG